jgi:hypothetical protein
VTELTPERLQRVMERFGFTEQEARIFIYLREAEDLFDKITREDLPESQAGSLVAHFIWTETHTHEHFNALRRHLAQRVLSRHYPKGWGYVPPEEAEEG